MAKVNYNLSVDENKLIEMKILATKNKMPLNKMLVFIFDKYKDYICDETLNETK